MAASAPLLEQWHAVAQTKFRAPRLRRDVILRPALSERLVECVDHHPVTLVCAPGGSGKTTLLAQLAPDDRRNFTILWATIDADDNDTNRLFAALIQMVQPLELSWEVDPRTLISGVATSKAHVRAALAALVNALCTTSVPRIVLVLDDLHRIENPEAFELLDSLIERLPDHVAVVLGSRVEPPLSLARWRTYGELAVFGTEDLQFTREDAAALGEARFGQALDDKTVQDALSRTHGWAAGLALLLQSRKGRGATAAIDSAESDRQLFQYLAQEILEELPADLQDFVLQCSILLELSPRLCAALTRRDDARQVLDSLYRRNLFLTALDETTPVLRFHDLFREFLEAELARRDPSLKRELHERAAACERIHSRAIYHLLAARRWDEAMQRIEIAGEERVEQGGIATVERWIDSIPESVRRTSPSTAYLRGTCAWFRWDWTRAKHELAVAVDGFTAPEQSSQRQRAIFHLIDALNSSGEREAAKQRIEQASRFDLDELGETELALQRSWVVSPDGDPAGVLKYMQEFVARVERNPRALGPVTADRIHCMLIGIPGMAETFERFYAACGNVGDTRPAPWQISVLTVGAWSHFWRGRKNEALATIQQAEHLQHQFGTIRLVIERLGQLRALFEVALRNLSYAHNVILPRIEAMQTPEMAGHSAVWLRPYRFGLARFHWVAENADGFRELLPHLIAPRSAGEWPFVDMAAHVVRGQMALFEKQWDLAERSYREALRTHDKLRLPIIHADPRLGLAYVLLQQGKKADAWAAFQPAYQEVIGERALGLLLLESRTVVNTLLEIVPADLRRTANHTALTSEWAAWNVAAPAPDGDSGLLTPLSERETEVLAEVASGASNKHIARQLSLSLHTVKRHIANILDKLGCDSRGQAADLYRRATAEK